MQDADGDELRHEAAARQAEAAKAREDYKTAERLFAEALSLITREHPEYLLLLQRRLTCLLSDGQHRAALLLAISSLQECDQGWARGHLLKAIALENLGMGCRAAACAAVAVHMDPHVAQSPIFEQLKTKIPKFYVVPSCSGRGASSTSAFEKLLHLTELNGEDGVVFLLPEGEHHIHVATLLTPVKIVGLANRDKVRVVWKRHPRWPLQPNAIVVAANSCVIENVTIIGGPNHAVLGVPGGQGYISNCIIKSYSGDICSQDDSISGFPLVSADASELYLDNCEICGNTTGGGVMSTHPGGKVVLRDCDIHHQLKSGLEALFSGTLEAYNCTIHDNRQGALMWKKPGKVLLQECHFYNHTNEGLLLQDCGTKQQPIIIQQCRISYSGAYGVSLDADVRCKVKDCQIFGNTFHGVLIKGNSAVEVAQCEVFGNKCGGIWLGLNLDARVLVKDCHIHDNQGEGFVSEYHRHKDAMDRMVKANPSITKRLKKDKLYCSTAKPLLQNNVLKDNTEFNKHPNKKSKDKRTCGFCCTTQLEAAKPLQHCSGCGSEFYCSPSCQKAHWKVHKRLCKLIQADYTLILNTTPTSDFYLGEDKGQVFVNTPHPSLKPKKNTTAPKAGEMLIVKIQSTENNPNPSQPLRIYDESRAFDVFVNGSSELFHFILENGCLGASQFTSKKVFVYAQLMDNPTKPEVKLLLRDLAPWQKW